MLIFPAIDLKDGKAVRLRRGDFSTVHQVADDPLETARTFCAAGARYLHMVDLDGARDGIRKNSAIVRAAASAQEDLNSALQAARTPRTPPGAGSMDRRLPPSHRGVCGPPQDPQATQQRRHHTPDGNRRTCEPRSWWCGTCCDAG